MRLCRDDFRTMHFTWSNLPDRGEQLITEMMEQSIEALLRKRCNVLIDATHCKTEYLNRYINRFGHLADISFKIFETDKKILIERCDKRYRETGKFIPHRVITRYVEELNELKETFDFSPRPLVDKRVQVIEQDTALPKAIICDLDGTLALLNGRNPFNASTCVNDGLNTPVAEILKTFAEKGYHVLLVSGREDCYREQTLAFLDKHAIPYHELLMRKSKDYRQDGIIKKEIYRREIEGKYYIEFILDDRTQVVDVWRRDIKLPCFQVNYGDF